jgi:hypothetical protein
MNTERQIITAVKAMREAQKEYFRTRSHESLRKSKALEKRVDDMIEEFFNPKQLGLF